MQMRRKKFKFSVKLTVHDLSSIPALNGVIIFCKARLLTGGEFSAITQRGQVSNHCVSWSKVFSFPCKLSSSISTGVLDTCICRISVRKEVKGGKSHDKLGYVDLNLAEFAGCGSVSRRYILEGYNDKKSRQDNSILKVTASMTLTSGDPLFKPQVSPQDQLLSGSISAHHTSDSVLNTGTYKKLDDNGELRKSHSDSFSGPLSNSTSHIRSPSSSSNKLFAAHSRDSSIDKRLSSLTSSSQHAVHHSRQSSSISTGDSACADLDTYHPNSPAAQIRNIKRSGDVCKRIDETRVNADDIIDQLLNGADLTADTSKTDEGIDLSLFLETDGVSTMSKIENKRRRDMSPIEDRFKTL